MCKAKHEPNWYRCPLNTRWCVNRETHESHSPDEQQERHWFKPVALLRMTVNAIKTRRHRAAAYCREVDAIRTVHGVPDGTPIGPVLREELWSQRFHGAALSTVALAERFRAIAADEGVPVEEVAKRYQKGTVRPNRQAAGQRLADLVVKRPEWVRPEHLVAMIEPPGNGEPNPAYCRVVTDLDGTHAAQTSDKPNPYGAVFPTRTGTWQQVTNVERRWRQIRQDTRFDWVTPHVFRKTVTTLVDRVVDTETAARLAGHGSTDVTKEFYIAKDASAVDVSSVVEAFAAPKRRI